MVVAGKTIAVFLGLNNMRACLVILGLAGLAACSPTVPESGVGFQDYNSYLRSRELQATGAVTAPDTPIAPGGQTFGAPVSGFSPDSAAAAIDRADGVTTGAIIGSQVGVTPAFPPVTADGERPRGNAPVGIKEEFGEVAAVAGSAAISDEQDFEAVSARETIESDAARIERNRSQYVVIQPGALPVRPGETGPNIVAYALATNNAPGVALYNRSGNGRNAAANCARYGSPDLAQEAFLESGGPDRDRKGLDPDGDGFACTWDPRPFRTALQ